TFDDWKTRTVLISAQEQILEAVRLRDAEAAAKAMRALLTTTKNTLLAAMQQYKVDDAPDVYY
ncbi:MAG: hypothetical protein OYG32_10915, partial [Rhodospirillaceae bacterium]|nr:hypothetical protein [Rhodospirillaceae bacterium]